MKKVISTEQKPIKMWLDNIEESALQQAKNVANLPFTFKHVALMPDSHMGFGVPIIEWFKDELKEYFLHYLAPKRLDQEGFFNTSEVIRLRDGYLSGDYNKNSAKILWNILIFELWYERWM